MADQQEAVETTETDDSQEVGFRTLDYSNEMEIEQYDPDAVEPEVKSDPTVDDLRSQVERLQQRLESSSNNDAISQGFAQLGEQLKSINNTQPTAQTQAKAEDIEEFKKKLKDNFFDDPVAAMEQFMEKTIREKVNPALTQIAQTTVKQGKQAVASDPTAQFVLGKYSDEVEQLIQSGQVPFGADTYQQAINRVAANHLSEVVTHLSSQQQQAEQTKPEAKGSNPSGTSAASPEAPAKPKVRVSKAAYSRIEQEAEAMGISTEARINWLRENNPAALKR